MPLPYSIEGIGCSFSTETFKSEIEDASGDAVRGTETLVISSEELSPLTILTNLRQPSEQVGEHGGVATRSRRGASRPMEAGGKTAAPTLNWFIAVDLTSGRTALRSRNF